MDKIFTYKEIEYLRDGKKFVDAWRQAFGRDVDERLFDWLFGAGSNNHIYVALCEDDNNKIAGGYCLLKQEAIINNETYLAYLCNNVFTVPEYRAYNVFVRLGRFALTQKKGERSMALGFPNQLALAGHKRVGWSICEPINFFERIPSTVEINSNFSLQDISEKDLLKIEHLWRDNVVNSSFCIVKNKTYFKWRYFDRPQIGRRYLLKSLIKDNNLFGYMVLSHFFEKNKMHIIDIMARTPEAYSFLILNACNLAHDLKADAINVWGTPILMPFIMENGFSPDGEEMRLIVKDLSGIEDRSICGSMKLHNIVLGDNDVY
jgi:hypothetical protein